MQKTCDPPGDILRAYLKDVRKFKRLSSDEMTTLINRIQNGDIEARNELVEHNLRLVMWVARKYHVRGVDYMDIVQEGNLGLIRATEKHQLGFGFSSYAIWWIRSTIERALINKGLTVRIPVEVRQFWNKIDITSAFLEDKLKRRPEMAEIAAEMDIPISKIVRTIGNMKIKKLTSIDSSNIYRDDDSDDNKSSFILDTVPTKENLNPDQILLAKDELKIAIRKIEAFKQKLALLSKIKKNHRNIKIFMKRYGLNDNLETEGLEKLSRQYSMTTKQGLDSIVRRVWSLLKKNGCQENKEWLTHEISRIHLLSEALGLSIEEAFTI